MTAGKNMYIKNNSEQKKKKKKVNENKDKTSLFPCC